tara:strand:+ start:866 stop:1726 length:861 start_codon:yes stop_codon:yes gene_type:complete
VTETTNAETRTFQVACELSYVVGEPSTFIMNVAPAGLRTQTVTHETISMTPYVEPEHFTEPTTGTRYHRFRSPHANEVTIRLNADVTYCAQRLEPASIVLGAPEDIPLEILPYLYPSRYCQSDLLERLTQREFGRIEPGYMQIVAICEWIRANVDYLYGTTGPLTSAYDTAVARAGVCRDFTHLGIAFSRALNIPARFVSGYAEGLNPPDFHAMFEVWLGDRWYMFDPTGLVSPAGMVRIGTGRDAADVAFAFIFGPATMAAMSVYCHETTPHTAERTDGMAVVGT